VKSIYDYPIRKLFALVRAGLDSAGRQDIPFEQSWVNDEREGYLFTIDMPVGPDLVLPLVPLERMVEVVDHEQIERFATSLVRSAINMKRAEKMIGRYVNAVARAARREIEAARASGLDVLLERVGLKPTYSWHLAHSDWKEAAAHALAQVNIRNTSFYLRPEITSVIIEEPDDVAYELSQVFEDQRERQSQLQRLQELGADLEVDSVTVDLLRVHGFSITETLREVHRSQCVNLPESDGDPAGRLSITSSSGSANASLVLKDAIWNGSVLWFVDEVDRDWLRARVGGTLGERINHPVLASLEVAEIERLDTEHRPMIRFKAADQLLFDAETGRLWSMP